MLALLARELAPPAVQVEMASYPGGKEAGFLAFAQFMFDDFIKSMDSKLPAVPLCMGVFEAYDAAHRTQEAWAFRALLFRLATIVVQASGEITTPQLEFLNYYSNLLGLAPVSSTSRGASFAPFTTSQMGSSEVMTNPQYHGSVGSQIGNRGPDGLLHDPQEDDPRLHPIFQAVEKEAMESAARIRNKDSMGFYRVVESQKRTILKSKYGIEWKSPSELNPGVHMD